MRSIKSKSGRCAKGARRISKKCLIQLIDAETKKEWSREKFKGAVVESLWIWDSNFWFEVNCELTVIKNFLNLKSFECRKIISIGFQRRKQTILS